MSCRIRDNSPYSPQCGNEANMQWLSFATYKQIIHIKKNKIKKIVNKIVNKIYKKNDVEMIGCR